MSAPREKILFILTSHSELGDTGGKTGYYLPEIAQPYYVLTKKYELVFATPKGGKAPLDPISIEDFLDDPVSQRFLADPEAIRLVENTHLIGEFVGRESEFVAVVYPGGHGLLWDLYDHKESLSIGAKIYEQGGVVGAICHGSAAILNIKLSNGEYLVKDKRVTSFTNMEEEVVEHTKIVPYRVEDALKDKNAIFVNGGEWAKHVVVDERLVTGQNPQSATVAAEAIFKLLTTGQEYVARA